MKQTPANAYAPGRYQAGFYSLGKPDWKANYAKVKGPLTAAQQLAITRLTAKDLDKERQLQATLLPQIEKDYVNITQLYHGELATQANPNIDTSTDNSKSPLKTIWGIGVVGVAIVIWLIVLIVKK